MEQAYRTEASQCRGDLAQEEGSRCGSSKSKLYLKLCPKSILCAHVQFHLDSTPATDCYIGV